MRSVFAIGISCFFLSIAPSPGLTAATPDPAIDIEKVWSSLQSICGSWTTESQSQVEWKQEDHNRIKKVISEAGEEQMIGQLIRREDAIFYELEKDGKIVSLELKQASASSWFFASETDVLLQKVQLSLINGEVLINEIVAQSPSGRRFTIQSKLSRR